MFGFEGAGISPTAGLMAVTLTMVLASVLATLAAAAQQMLTIRPVRGIKPRVSRRMIWVAVMFPAIPAVCLWAVVLGASWVAGHA